MNKRWYDADPVITNAVNLIQNSDNEKKNLMADFIIREVQALGVEIEKGVFDCFWQRRQEENKKYFMALEYLKAAEKEAGRELAFKIISTFKDDKNTTQT